MAMLSWTELRGQSKKGPEPRTIERPLRARLSLGARAMAVQGADLQQLGGMIVQLSLFVVIFVKF